MYALCGIISGFSMFVKVPIYGVSIPQRVNGNGRHKFYIGYVEEQLLKHDSELLSKG